MKLVHAAVGARTQHRLAYCTYESSPATVSHRLVLSPTLPLKPDAARASWRSASP
jgi:hypothetical protein